MSPQVSARKEAKMMLTNSDNCNILKESTERRIFYVYQTGNLERGKPNRFSVDRLRLPFLLESIMRKCTKCKKILPLNMFYRRVGRPLGIQSACKKCFCKTLALSRIKHLSKFKKRVKEYRLKNKSRINNYIRESGQVRGKNWVKRLISLGQLKSLKLNFIKCVDCKKRATEYDHRDYNKPKIVEPVCHSCNSKRGKAIFVKAKKGGV